MSAAPLGLLAVLPYKSSITVRTRLALWPEKRCTKSRIAKAGVDVLSLSSTFLSQPAGGLTGQAVRGHRFG